MSEGEGPSSGGNRRRGRRAPGVTTGRRHTGPTRARLLAVRVLERVERVRAYADIALNHALAQSNLPAVDRALTTELVYGTLRWRGHLDFVLQNAIDRKLDDLEPVVLTALRLGVYQILFMDRIPATAAVDEAVRCTRAFGVERATGFVNAVLRRIAREGREVEPPSLEADPVAHLRDELSFPEWMAERFCADLGPEAAAAFALASNQPPPLTIRNNRQRRSRDELLEKLRTDHPGAVACVQAPDGIVLGRKGDPRSSPEFVAGDFSVQDEAAQLVVELLDPQGDERILDTCAAPGTKTTAIAERLGEGGHVLALDRNPQRLNLVARSVRRLGLRGIQTLARDASRSLLDLPSGSEDDATAGDASFDRVLVDAPCSGLGTLRRNPDARWRVRPEDPQRLYEIQGRILDRAVEVLRPGGTLVYSTCTVLSEENEEVVEAFLSRHEGCRIVERSALPDAVQPWTDESGFLRTAPHLHDADGFFAARITKEH